MTQSWSAHATTLLGIALLSTITPGVTRAEWAALSWDACGAEVFAKQFACDTNAGSSRSVISALRDSVEPTTTGFECSVEIVVAQGQPLSWWQFAAGQCRTGAIGRTVVPQGEDAACIDVWSGMLSHTMTVTNEPSVPRIGLQITAVDPTESVAMQPLIETFVVAIEISHAKTIGADACEGCASSACILLKSLTFVDQSLNRVTMPLLSGHEMLAWQTTTPGCLATPARNRSWGAIKSLYR